ncbi:winged helix-turn-helix transcriptional regulator [Protaetiibacter mangrovi]|uniref:Helix-turn-helix transcriptional regulator n=1 Tax=Protaetiibacter mangrovi TaxID=2970926 RepID=A0ABT1ZD11_9MICO|nr:helix-turn-helix domain-containing protein [Protaetiibacter mangrovi]MCS0498587.1 helix-turn-helix transcriptional regulator [Protaetiibacter mangrovi]TPX04621.1 helix-turn-helix transcriptional regulator [Schumannella luteola]
MTVSVSELRALPGFDDTLLTEGCPTRVVLDHVTSKWGVLVLLALSDGTHRWGELRRAVDGISEKMLAQTLRVLEGDSLVLRDAHPTIPPHVEYSLTASGRELVDRLLPLVEWIARNTDRMLPPAERAAG